MQNIVVLENLQDNIIGIDYINKHFFAYSAYKQSPVWKRPPINSGKFRTTKRVYLDALSSRIVKIKCQDEEGKTFGRNTTMIATIGVPHTLVKESLSRIKLNGERVALTIFQN